MYQPTPEMVQALEKARQPLYDQYLEDVNKKGLPGKAFLDELISLSKQYK